MALRFPTADINSPAAAGVNCQEEGMDLPTLRVWGPGGNVTVCNSLPGGSRNDELPLHS